ncbi:helix-turn-helix transcriptional regulator [Weissella sagaensis]|uniref:helix-turn-helix domain-containing protein n=1 Tax=Weissella sagaensis TaxID=2559928 RepID=UPI0013EAE3FA|nr:helix-turn-helix transcriptional regulator [Weissella sagaensis]UEG66456.1 helix-turn-helix domain-containing protein [Weissella hellenica]
MNRLKELRTKKGLTLQELSKEVNISFGALGNYENERREPKLATWKKLADYFGVSVGYLQGVSDVKVRFEDRVKDSDVLNITNKVQNKETLNDKEFNFFMDMFDSESLNEASNIISAVDRLIHPYSDLSSNDFPDLLISDTALKLIELIIDSASDNSRNRKKARSKDEIIAEFKSLYEQLKEFNND